MLKIQLRFAVQSAVFFVYRKENGNTENDGKVPEEELHPLVSVSNINPEDIPDVPVNKFLMRGAALNEPKENRKRGALVLLCFLFYLLNVFFFATKSRRLQGKRWWSSWWWWW